LGGAVQPGTSSSLTEAQRHKGSQNVGQGGHLGGVLLNAFNDLFFFVFFVSL
jgi:hypothetical protein